MKLTTQNSAVKERKKTGIKSKTSETALRLQKKKEKENTTAKRRGKPDDQNLQHKTKMRTKLA
jgi:hypothetical protein